MNVTQEHIKEIAYRYVLESIILPYKDYGNDASFSSKVKRMFKVCTNFSVVRFSFSYTVQCFNEYRHLKGSICSLA